MKNADRMEAIAREIFSQVRTTIVMNMRFMDMAVFRLRPVAEDVTLATDGELLYYGPAWLLKRYRGEANAVARDYFHVLLHCIFRHPFVHTLVNRELWDLACDIAVEGLICELDQPHLRTSMDARRRAVVDGLRRNVSPLTAEKLYSYFQRCTPDAAWAGLFRADDHDIWHNPRQAREMAQQANGGEREESQPSPSQQPTPQQDQGQGEGDEREPNEAGKQGKENGEKANSSSDSSNQGGSGGDTAGEPQTQEQDASGQSMESQFNDSFRQAREEMWRDISEHVQMDLETFAKQQGTKAGSLTQQLAELNRERYDYEAFLKKFAVMGEVMKINDDEFDYTAWQLWLTSQGKKQLFEQVWEPVINWNNGGIRRRYNGVVLSSIARIRVKRRLEQRGVDVWVEDGRTYIMHFGHCLSMKYRMDNVGKDTIFETAKKTDSTNHRREMNAVLLEMDRAAISTQILKDNDVALIDAILAGFTAAQISEFLNLAIDQKSPRCTAKLLDYKNQRFPEFSEMDEFTLDW